MKSAVLAIALLAAAHAVNAQTISLVSPPGAPVIVRLNNCYSNAIAMIPNATSVDGNTITVTAVGLDSGLPIVDCYPSDVALNVFLQPGTYTVNWQWTRCFNDICHPQPTITRQIVITATPQNVPIGPKALVALLTALALAGALALRR